MKSVIVVVLSWNKSSAVIDCIDRVRALKGANVDIVIVDNASADDSVAAIRRAHRDVTVIAEPVNRGFAGGVNRGLAEAARRGADFAWLLNDDTAFADDALVPLLAHAANDASSGLLSPRLHDLDDEGGGVQFANGVIDWRLATMRHNLPDAVLVREVGDGATPIVAGTALLVDLRVYRAIGPFDERFFAYWEDTDYAIRAARAGFVNAVVAASTVSHAAPRSAMRPPHYHYYMTRNEALFWRLHARGATRRRWQRRWLSHALETIGRQRDLALPANVQAVVDAIWHAWTRRYGARDAHRPAPAWLHRLLLAAPYVASGLLRGELRPIARRLLRQR